MKTDKGAYTIYEGFYPGLGLGAMHVILVNDNNLVAIPIDHSCFYSLSDLTNDTKYLE